MLQLGLSSPDDLDQLIDVVVLDGIAALTHHDRLKRTLQRIGRLRHAEKTGLS